MRRWLLVLAIIVGIAVPLEAALTDTLESFWSLEEASGTRDDAHGSNDLTDNNTVANAAGKVGNAADLESANSESLTRADNASLSVGNNDFTFCAWAWVEDFDDASEMTIIGKGGENDLPYAVDFDNGDTRFRFRVSSATGFTNLTEVLANNLGEPADLTWYYICAWHDASANTINIQVNDGTVDSQAYASGSYDDGGDFAIGAFPFYGNYWDGLVDQVGFWKRVLTTQERTDLYNAGDGLSYAAMQPVNTCKGRMLIGFFGC